MARSFDDLEIWKQAHALTIQIYNLTSTWPKSEVYGLISQIRRAAISVELNIAEGHARFHFKEMINFMYNARGSAEEVRNCLMIAKDLDFKLTDAQFEEFNVKYQGLIKGINDFVSYLRSRN